MEPVPCADHQPSEVRLFFVGLDFVSLLWVFCSVLFGVISTPPQASRCAASNLEPAKANYQHYHTFYGARATTPFLYLRGVQACIAEAVNPDRSLLKSLGKEDLTKYGEVSNLILTTLRPKSPNHHPCCNCHQQPPPTPLPPL